jgi:hypothetical protein
MRISIVIVILFNCLYLQGCHANLHNQEKDVREVDHLFNSPCSFLSRWTLLTVHSNKIWGINYNDEQSQAPLNDYQWAKNIQRFRETYGKQILEVTDTFSIDSSASNSITGDIAYTAQYRDTRSQHEALNRYELKIIDSSCKKTFTIFRSSQMIHSLSWSPNGKSVAFMVGVKEPFVDWGPQCLYLIREVNSTDEKSVQDLGYISVNNVSRVFDPRLSAPQIIWSEDGESLFWVSKKNRIMERNCLTLQSKDRFKTHKVERLYGVFKTRFLVGKSKPWRLSWLDTDDPKAEKKIIRLGIAGLGTALFIPDSSVICLAVDARKTASMILYDYTLFMDARSGKVLGRLDIPVCGFVPRQ